MDKIVMNDTNNSIVSTKLDWHKGPALGGTGTAGPNTWFDGDNLLIAVELKGGDWEIAHVLISCDEESFEVLLADGSGDSYSDWSPDDWLWWAKLDKTNTPPFKSVG